MPILGPAQRQFLRAIADLAHCNPFLPERVEFERQVLGRQFTGAGPVWSASAADPDAKRPNVWRIQAKLESALEAARSSIMGTDDPGVVDVALYEECVHFLLYQRYYSRFVEAGHRAPFYEQFRADWDRYFDLPGKRFETAFQPHHLFSCFRQIQRAFHHIFDNIIGSSMPAALLRASVWQSIFTHDMRRYRRTLYARMGDFPTLITGPSGTGKELVARAIAGSRYVTFDPRAMEFADPQRDSFFPINLAAMAPLLIESELFGHRRGAFTGAVGERKGWLESCPAAGSVFLDELGEMDLSIQVKLLRVIETRRFSAVGDTALRQFHGKLIAATNRDLTVEIRGGRFREDLYYRLCADLVRTPALAEQIRESPEMLRDLLLFMVRRAVGEEAERSLPEVVDWVERHLPRDYEWPGNYREVEQCVRNVLIRKSYQPIESTERAVADDFTVRLRGGELTADEMLARYATLVYQKTGSYERAARKLGLDRRTVKAKVAQCLAEKGEAGIL